MTGDVRERLEAALSVIQNYAISDNAMLRVGTTDLPLDVACLRALLSQPTVGREEVARRFARFASEALANSGLRHICVRDDAPVAFMEADKLLALLAPSGAPGGWRELHPATAAMVANFADALAAKLRRSEEKYGYSDGWARTDWREECQAQLLEHVRKGDPLDVAAYAAFCWAHGWPSSPALASEPGGGNLKDLRRDFLDWEAGLLRKGELKRTARKAGWNGEGEVVDWCRATLKDHELGGGEESEACSIQNYVKHLQAENKRQARMAREAALAASGAPGLSGELRGLEPLHATTPSGAPGGWRLVPLEPTQAMLAALVDAGNGLSGSDLSNEERERVCYRAMLAAAPALAAPEPVEEGS